VIVVGYRRSPEGGAALHFAAEEAVLRDDEVTVVHIHTPGEDADGPSVEQDLDGVRDLLRERGVRGEVLEAPAGDPVVERILAVVEQTSAELLVIGIRRRSPVGKLLLGSTAQRLILTAPVAVACVPAGG
jgi:nucleotide-binding universal stress UspA family protein